MGARTELVADRRLLDPTFEGYKLGGGEIPALRAALASPPGAGAPRPDRSSPLHVRLHALHNALADDPFGPRVYYADEAGGVWAVDGDLSPRLVLPASEDRRARGEHPPTLAFASDRLALLASGAGGLRLLDTGDRRGTGEAWRVEAGLEPLGPDGAFGILDARAETAGGLEVHCLLYAVRDEERRAVGTVDWIVLEASAAGWNLRPHRKIACPGAIHYCALEPGCEAIFVAAERPPVFEGIAPPPQPPANPSPGKKYAWIQSADDVTLTLRPSVEAAEAAGAPPVVRADGRSIDVRFGDVRFGGRLAGETEVGMTTWNLDGAGNLSVLLLKREAGVNWTSLLKDGDPDGEEITDPCLVAEVHARLAHLCAESEATVADDAPAFDSRQLEECDLVTEEESCLVRMHGPAALVTHRAFLSAHQTILSVRIHPSEARALGLRCDADACVWQPYAAAEGEWPVRHEGTLPAFGYVQCSKRQKKYAVCSPDLEYAVVAEPRRHIFVYRRTHPNCRLRSRVDSGDGRTVKIGMQQLISVDREEEILGICAKSEVLYVLGRRCVIAFDMN